MTIFKPLRKILLPAVGGVFGLVLGCVITTNGKDCTQCGNTFCKSQLVDGECFCDPNHQWKEPNNPNDYECVRIPGKGGSSSSCSDPNSHLDGNQCFCDPGYTWCNPADDQDLSCCPDDDQVLDGTSGPGPGTGDHGETDDADGTAGETDGPTCDLNPPACPPPAFEPEPADCNPDTEGFVACSNSVEQGAECSVYWVCDGNDWVEDTQTLDAICVSLGADFAAGCVDDGVDVLEVCGLGPGTPCEGDCDECVDDEIIQFCAHGALNQDNCFVVCTELGDADGITYDHGECNDGFCNCCDFEDEGCAR